MISIKTIDVNIKELLLDANNPRFAKHKDQLVSEVKIGEEKIQKLTFNRMLEGFDVESLSANILKNGYLGFDRIFIKKSLGEKYIVVEGNRRVSSIKLLIKNEESGQNADIIPINVKKSFEKIPAIDVTSLSEEEIQRMLGLRHFDSVKDWSALPASLHLFRAYMKIQLGDFEEDIDDMAEQFLYDAKIISRVSEQFSVKKTKAKKSVQIYRLYLQVVDFEHSALSKNNIFSMLEEVLTPDAIIRFGIDPQKATFTLEGLELFVKLVVGEKGEDAIITEVSKGDRAFREYKKILKDGTDEDKLRVEVGTEETSAVWAEIKNRMAQETFKQIVGRIKNDLSKITVEKLDIKELSNADIETVQKLQENTTKILAALNSQK